jgi:hypothetical protein
MTTVTLPYQNKLSGTYNKKVELKTVTSVSHNQYVRKIANSIDSVTVTYSLKYVGLLLAELQDIETLFSVQLLGDIIEFKSPFDYAVGKFRKPSAWSKDSVMTIQNNVKVQTYNLSFDLVSIGLVDVKKGSTGYPPVDTPPVIPPPLPISLVDPTYIALTSDPNIVIVGCTNPTEWRGIYSVNITTGVVVQIGSTSGWAGGSLDFDGTNLWYIQGDRTYLHKMSPAGVEITVPDPANGSSWVHITAVGNSSVYSWHINGKLNRLSLSGSLITSVATISDVQQVLQMFIASNGYIYFTTLYGYVIAYAADLSSVTINFTVTDAVYGICEDGVGNIWITTDTAMRKYDSAGALLATYTGFTGLRYIHYYNSKLYIARNDIAQDQVIILNLSGGILQAIDVPEAPQELIHSNGNLVVASLGADIVTVIYGV